MYLEEVGIFKKVFNWFKSNWMLVLLLLAIVFLFARGCEQSSTYEDLFDQYLEQGKLQQEQLNDLRKIQNEEYEKLNEQIKNYVIEVERIEKEYKEEIEKISISQENRRTKIIRDHSENPETLTESLYQTFGIPIE